MTDTPTDSLPHLLQTAENLEGDARLVALTFAARRMGEEGRVADAHALLDEIAADRSSSPEVVARLALERAWLVIGESDETAPDRAAEYAREAAAATASLLDETPLGGLHVEALRLRARCADTTDERIASLQKAVQLAGSSKDPDAHAWRARLLIDLAHVDYEADKLGLARQRLEEAVQAGTETGDEPAVTQARELLDWLEAETLRREQQDPTVQHAHVDMPEAGGHHKPRRAL